MSLDHYDIFLQTKFFHLLTPKQLIAKLNQETLVRVELYTSKDPHSKPIELISPVWSQVSDDTVLFESFLEETKALIDSSVIVRIESFDGQLFFLETHQKFKNNWLEVQFKVTKLDRQDKTKSKRLILMSPSDSGKYLYEEARKEAVRYKGRLLYIQHFGFLGKVHPMFYTESRFQKL